MKKIKLLIVCTVSLLFLSVYGYAQIWNGDLIFSSQQQIDDFTNLPYTSVNGNLEINDAGDGQHNIRNLAGLAGLNSVTGNVTVQNNNLLINTIYLNLVNIGGAATFRNNPALTILNGMNGILSLQGQIDIQSNSSLGAVTAFSGLTTIGSALYSQNNAALTTLSGFSNLVTINGSCSISYNNSLLNLNAFASLTTVGTTLNIHHNPNHANVKGLQA